ncbi:hypothetical protein [Teichococcus aestuarii]|uniref:hypothetical protein n=1 Tax=Teichococcus aestuarii TaxID=568898 RepID=UPI003615E211
MPLWARAGWLVALLVALPVLAVLASAAAPCSAAATTRSGTISPGPTCCPIWATRCSWARWWR